MPLAILSGKTGPQNPLLVQRLTTPPDSFAKKLFDFEKK
jgi:hypothetical protein